ncbi:MAG: putative Fe-S cluster assembly protein SufT [Candidatus Pelagibacter sp. TMED118]|nr:MAG: putative Fe-S cluster assembly protein SufT [Candidatus Pelagibacter sp. TMED118]|tara:strand:+ start:4193 stop:4714 length:522 start_codon:yes stop_codon:yes gene_type:complete
MHEEFTILEDVIVHSVPDGIRTTLKKGMSGIISQSLGDNYTVIVEGNMYQVNGIDGEAIGQEKREVDSNNFANEEEVWNVLHTCYDPEIPVNIVDLGLVYNCLIKEEDDGVNILIQMTLTAPGCGMGPVIAGEVKQKLSSLSGAKEVEVELVWEPQWNQDMMSDAAKLQLGLY